MPSEPPVVIELFVQGQSALSNAALEMVQRVCEDRLEGRYQLDVVDIQQQPERTRDAGIPAAPTLVRLQPEPVIRAVGRLSEQRIMEVLGVLEAAGEGDDP